jgi:uncharacterized membrane protein YedE/YeeE
VAGPLIGLMVPALVLLNRRFGVSTSMMHVCAATIPASADAFQYNWRRDGAWNLFLVGGVAVGGLIAAQLLPAGPIDLAPATVEALEELGLTRFDGLAPPEIFAWDRVGTPVGFLSMVVGGFLVGFGARVAGGCTSGHAISGMAEMKASSLVSVIGFFIGGLTVTYLVLPAIL